MDYLSRITAILILLNCIGFFIRKYKGLKITTLHCGLFGFSGWDRANIAKLKILGIYNIKRGRDSCGYWFNGKLVKGTYGTKEWDDFIEKTVIDEKGSGNHFIGHTRWSTVGQNTEANAHPFMIKDKLVLAHNGTISNWEDLCKKYGIDTKDINVDSQALGHLIDHLGVKILEEYRGYAALLFHRLSEPDSIYVYHGASKLWQHAKDATEERPMFFMTTREGVYFSSLEESLLAIRDSEDQKPYTLVHNKVFKVTKGKFAKSGIVIDREWNNLDLEKKTTTYYNSNTNNMRAAAPAGQPKVGGINTANSTPTPTTPTTGTNSSVKTILPSDNNGFGTALNTPIENDNRLNVWNETYPPRSLNTAFTEYDFLFYHMGRYWHVDAQEKAHGIVLLDKYGVVYDTPGDKVYEHYFWDGIMMKGKKEYESLIHDIDNKKGIHAILSAKANSPYVQVLSKYSKYPITYLPDEGRSLPENIKTGWYHNMAAAKGGVTPLWADRSYTFKDGNLVNIIADNKGDVIFIDEKADAKFARFANTEVFTHENKPLPLSDKVDFEDGEWVEIGSKPLLDAETEIKPVWSKPVQSLAKFFDCKYKDLDEAMANCPSTVFKALRTYLKNSTLSGDFVPTEAELDEYVIQFLTTSIKDAITFRDNMNIQYPEPEVYLHEEYLKEIAEDEEETDDDRNFIDEIKRCDEIMLKSAQNLGKI